MARLLRRFLIWLVVALITVPAVTVTSWAMYLFHPTVSLGRDIGHLSYTDQLAYLILVDQLSSNYMMRGGKSHFGSNLSVVVRLNGQSCQGAGADLMVALKASSIADKFDLSAAGCDQAPLRAIIVFRDYNALVEDYRCPGWCGYGNRYAAYAPLGINLVLRLGPIYH